MSIWLKDPKTNEPSVTLTVFIAGFVIVAFKLLVAGMIIHNIGFPVFDGGDFATAIGALGGVYWLRRNVSSGDKPE